MLLRDLKLPAGLEKYSATKQFTKGTFPKSLERNHSTKPGVWGVLHVTTGCVEFHDDNLDETREIEAGQTQVILPETIHSAKPSPDAQFFVEFYRLAGQDQDAAPGDGA